MLYDTARIKLLSLFKYRPTQAYSSKLFTMVFHNYLTGWFVSMKSGYILFISYNSKIIIIASIILSQCIKYNKI